MRKALTEPTRLAIKEANAADGIEWAGKPHTILYAFPELRRAG